MRRAHARERAARLKLLATIMGVTGLAGCVDSDLIGISNPLPSYSKPVDKPSNLIERALADCNQKTGDQEANCVKTALADASTSVASLIALVPNCRLGQMCFYRYTTHNQLGFIKSYAADLAIRWQVSFDLRHAGSMAAQVPITVAEVDG